MQCAPLGCHSSVFLKDAANRDSFPVAMSVPGCLKDATNRASFLIASPRMSLLQVPDWNVFENTFMYLKFLTLSRSFHP